MNRILKQFTLPAVIMLLVGLFGSLSVSAKLLPYDEEHFPDPVIRQWLQTRFPNAISNGKIETDKVTTVNATPKDLLYDYASNPYKNVEDLRCLRYFTKLTGDIIIAHGNFSKVKYIDVSGLNITSIKNGLKNNAYTTSADICKAPIVEIIADSCQQLTEFVFNNCPTLERVSIKDCPKLTSFYCGMTSQCKTKNTVLKTLDLTGSPDFERIWVQNNTNLVELRLPSEGRSVHLDYKKEPYTPNNFNIECGYCALEDLDLRNVFRINNNVTKTYITLNLNDNRIRTILFNNNYAPYPFQSFLITGNQLTALEIPYEDKKGYTVVTYSDNRQMSRNVGPDDEAVLNDGTMRGTVTNESGGKVNKSRGVFVFESPTTTIGKYTYKPYGESRYSQYFQFEVTLTRKKAMRMWVCGTFNGWTVDENGQWIKPEGWDEGKSREWELEYVGKNDYKLRYEGNVAGDFRILVNDPNYTGDAATYWLGASHADLVTPYTAIGGAIYSRQANANANGGRKIFDISSKPVKHYDTFHYVAHVKNEGKPLRVVKDSPYPFSTHPCEEQQQTTTHIRPLFHVNFVSGHRTSGTPSGDGTGEFDGGTVGVDGPDADLDAEEIWYNLQGVRVSGADPAPGIYIVRRGAKTTKVLIP